MKMRWGWLATAAALRPAAGAGRFYAVGTRRARRGLTITELLTVISIITVLTSFISPAFYQVQHGALSRACAHNLRQVYLGIQLVKNANFAKLPPCVELDTTDNPPKLQNYSLKEDKWWYRKVSAILYPNEGTVVKDPLQGYWLPPERFAMRCPGTADPYDQTRVKGAYWVVSGIDKDRVFDDSYGYNNFGFAYNVGDSAKENMPAIVDPATLSFGAIGNSAYYRDLAISWGPILGRPKHLYDSSKDAAGVKYCNCDTGSSPRKTWPCAYTRLGEFATVPEAASTMLMMDYIKADVAPNIANDGLRGYRFRHAGRANTLFVDGHIQTYTKPQFLKDWSEPDHASWGTANAPDKTTQHGRIHWAVLRP